MADIKSCSPRCRDQTPPPRGGVSGPRSPRCLAAESNVNHRISMKFIVYIYMCDLGGMQEFRRVASGRCWPGRKPASQTAGQPAGQLASEQAGPRCPRWHQLRSIFLLSWLSLRMQPAQSPQHDFKQPSKQASKQTSKQASEQTSKQENKQTSRRGKRTSRASEASTASKSSKAGKAKPSKQSQQSKQTKQAKLTARTAEQSRARHDRVHTV